MNKPFAAAVVAISVISAASGCAKPGAPVSGTALSAASERPRDCSGIELTGELQIVPLGNTDEIQGRFETKALEEVMGVGMNGLRVESPDSQGWQELAYFERNVPARIGEKVATAGRVKAETRSDSCVVEFAELKDKAALVGAYLVLQKLPNGNLILGDKSGVPAIVVKWIKEPGAPAVSDPYTFVGTPVRPPAPGGCSAVEIAGNLQIFSLADNSARIEGPIGDAELADFFMDQGLGMTTLEVRDAGDGWKDLAIVEQVLITRVGEKVGSRGQVKLLEAGAVCHFQFKGTRFGDGTYSVYYNLPNGNLILADESGAPAVVVKRIK
jgi:hypothetical protein